MTDERLVALRVEFEQVQSDRKALKKAKPATRCRTIACWPWISGSRLSGTNSPSWNRSIPTGGRGGEAPLQASARPVNPRAAGPFSIPLPIRKENR